MEINGRKGRGTKGGKETWSIRKGRAKGVRREEKRSVMKGTKNIGRTRERWTPHYEYSITT
jgi:hypothetical protein